MHRLTFVIATAWVLGLAGRAEALQCGERLVEVGDAQAYVRSVCGEPSFTRVVTETRTTGVTTGAVRAPVVVTVQVEIWTYDFGPERFAEELRFEQGVLVSERPMGPGSSRARRDDDPGAWHHHRDAHTRRDAERRREDGERHDD